MTTNFRVRAEEKLPGGGCVSLLSFEPIKPDEQKDECGCDHACEPELPATPTFSNTRPTPLSFDRYPVSYLENIPCISRILARRDVSLFQLVVTFVSHLLSW
jgi:hypothetical protein